jgi:hypothetical protein
MTSKSIAIWACLVFVAIAGWLHAQPGEIEIGGKETLLVRHFKATPIGNKSAILLDESSGESWYLRDADPGTVWLRIPKFNSLQALQEWREKNEE